MSSPIHSNQSVDLSEKLDRVMDEFMAEQRAGRCPSVHAYAEKYPELAESIRELFGALVWAEQLGDSAIQREYPNKLGDFDLHEEIGRGGMGVVFSATQRSLDRPVAIKILARFLSNDERYVARFLREAQSAARLQHPNIVQIYGNGQQNGFSFYAMQLIEGRSLSQILQNLRQVLGPKNHPRSPRESSSNESVLALSHCLVHQDLSQESVNSSKSSTFDMYTDRAESRSTVVSGASGLEQSGAMSSKYFRNVALLIRHVADGLHYAHVHGTIHRDVKPSNLLLDDQGRIWITDFGLAKIETESDITRTGDLVGTLRYIAPEQLAGQATHRCDIYSLGATMYEMLTLQPAISSENRVQILQQVREVEPTAPRLIDPRIPIDLETITLKAMSKDPLHRYASALEFCEDLQRFLDGRPILARPMTSLGKLVLWSKRNRALASALGALAAVLILTTLGSVFVAISFRELALSEKTSRLLADREQMRSAKAEETTRYRLYASEMNLGIQGTTIQGGLAKQLEILSDWKPEKDRADLRGWEWYYLQSYAHQEAFRWQHPEPVTSMHAATSVGVVAFCIGKEIDLYDIQQGAVTHRLRSDFSIRDIRLSPSGKRLVALHPPNRLSVWDLTVGDQPKLLESAEPVGKFEWNPDESEIAHSTLGEAKRISIYTIAIESGFNTQVIASPLLTTGCSLDYSPQGDRLAVCCDAPDMTRSPPYSIGIWDTKSWTEASRIPLHDVLPIALKWSPNGQQIGLIGYDSLVQVWNMDGQLQSQSQRTRNTLDIAWSADSKWLAGAGSDGTVLIWSPDSMETMDVLHHPSAVRSVAFWGDTKRISTVDQSGVLRFWDREAHRAERTLKLENQMDSQQPDVSVRWSHDDKRILAGAAFPTVCWDVASGAKLHSILGSFAEWSYDDKFVCSKFRDPVSVWDGNSFSLDRANESLGEGLLRAWSPISHCIAGAGPKSLWIWDVDRDEVRRSPAAITYHPSFFTCIAWNVEGDRIAVGVKDGNLHIFDATTLEKVGEWKPFEGAIHSIAWQPGGKSMAVSGAHPSIRILDAESGKVLKQFEGHLFEVWGLSWSGDSKRIASAGADERVIVWDAMVGIATASLPIAGEVRSVAWSHDSRKLAAVSQNGVVRIWSADIGYKMEAEDD